jgi:hypothetical protein
MKIRIQAGHYPEPFKPGNTGASSKWMVERECTPVVANACVKYLTAHGMDAETIPAKVSGQVAADMMVACHMDGGGGSGASVGYPYDNSAKFAAVWKGIYWPLFPGRKMQDNFTPGLRGYYMYHHTPAKIKMVAEFGDVGDEKQALWMKPRLAWLGQLMGYAILKYLGLAPAKMPTYGEPVVPPPAPPVVPKPKPTPEPDNKTEEIIAIQKGLAILYPDSPVVADGIYGKITQRWVKKFQRAHGLVVDGVFGPITKAAFDKALEPNPKIAEAAPPVVADEVPVPIEPPAPETNEVG